MISCSLLFLADSSLYLEGKAKMSRCDETWDGFLVASFLKEEGISEEYADLFEGKQSYTMQSIIIDFWIIVYSYIMIIVCVSVCVSVCYKGALVNHILICTENMIDGYEFTQLTIEDLLGMIKPVGIVKKIRRIVEKVVYIFFYNYKHAAVFIII